MPTIGSNFSCRNGLSCRPSLIILNNNMVSYKGVEDSDDYNRGIWHSAVDQLFDTTAVFLFK